MPASSIAEKIARFNQKRQIGANQVAAIPPLLAQETKTRQGWGTRLSHGNRMDVFVAGTGSFSL
jgi:hypothetical protein